MVLSCKFIVKALLADGSRFQRSTKYVILIQMWTSFKIFLIPIPITLDPLLQTISICKALASQFNSIPSHELDQLSGMESTFRYFNFWRLLSRNLRNYSWNSFCPMILWYPSSWAILFAKYYWILRLWAIIESQSVFHCSIHIIQSLLS